MTEPHEAPREEKVPISAVVVGLNEGGLLRDCLSSLSFCEQKLYVDLGSCDNSINIATELGWEVKKHTRVPIGEFIVAEMQDKLSFDWILFLDPDERVSRQLASKVIDFFSADVPESVGAISAPWHFYFKNHRLVGTPWGVGNTRPFIANRRRFSFTTEVHRGRQLLDGFDLRVFPGTNEAVRIDHYWVSSWKQLLSKHRRYLTLEGQSQYVAGRRTSFRRLVLSGPRLVKSVVARKRPLDDGLLGVGLSVFWVVYQLISEWKLLRYQQEFSKNRQSENIDPSAVD